MNRRSARELAPSVLVASLSSAFGVTVLQFVGVISQIVANDAVTGDSGTVAVFLGIVASVFIVIAMYVGAIVTANTFSTIIAGRTRTIALLRLIGSSARDQRRAVAREGLAVGVAGAVLGAIAGTVVTVATVAIALATDVMPHGIAFSFYSPQLFLPLVAVVLTTWLASWIGSRRVLVVSPMQATGSAGERSREEVASSRARNATAMVMFIVGDCILGLAVLLGFVTPLAVLVGVLGGILSFTGLIVGAHLVMPVALRFVGRLYGGSLGRIVGGSAPARLAAENAVRYPERSSRTTIGLVIGITLVTMFAVAQQCYQNLLTAAQDADPTYYAGIDEAFVLTIVIFSILIGFSAVIAAVGMVNNLSLSVLQRTREIGLLRALGFTAQQVRAMITAESAQLTAASVLVGLVLGTFYGWVGAQSMFGNITGSPGLVAPGMPLPFLAAIVVLAAVLTLVASVGPSRRATRVAPVTALAVE
jgi:putative ABC transport system permease protein